MEKPTNNLHLIYRSFLATALLSASGLAVAQTAATIPAGFHGTYEVTYSLAQPGSPVENGATTSLVVGAGGALCIADYVLANPIIEDGNTAVAVWTAADLDLKLAVSDITGSFTQLNVLTSTNASLGKFTGAKVSNSTNCDFLGGTPPDMTAVADIFKLAEQIYASIFPAASTSNAFQIVNGAITRNYQSTGVKIAITGGTVYVSGGEFGSEPVTIGTIANTRALLVAEAGGQTGGPVEEPKVEVPSGNYALTISGTVSATIFGNTTSTPITVTIDSIPAPDANDIDKIETEVKKSLENTEGVDVSTFANFQVSEVSVTDSRVFFRIRFAGTTVSSGITVNQSYNLTYEYIKK